MKAETLSLWPFVLLAWLLYSPGGLAGSVVSRSRTSDVAFEASQKPPLEFLDKRNASSSSNQVFQIITLDWQKVHIPFLITFWILVAFSARIGK